MPRQRTIQDSFWRSQSMSVRTVEDRYALLYFQTSPFSNIIGVYPLVLAIAASEMGWDVESQLKPVVKRLAEAGLVKFDEESGFIWITDWWIHNVATASIGPSLLGKSVKQIKAMPKEWQDDYLAEFIPRLNKNSRTYKQLCREFGYPDDSEVTDNADLEGSRSNVQHMAANRGVAHHDEHVDRGVAAHDDPVDRGSTPCRDSVGRSGGNTTTKETLQKAAGVVLNVSDRLRKF